MTDEPNRRRARLNQQFRREITEILLKSVRDPRVQDVVVNSVEVTADLWLARVYVRVGGDDAERAEALLGLDAAANFVRRELAGVLHIRRMPELRFLEDKTFRRVGGTSEISVDVRIIAATNRDLEKAIEEGQFRDDLMFRLDVIAIDLPAVRDRGDDVILLAEHYTAQFAKDFRKPITEIDEGAIQALKSYTWPGNVREIRNVIERAVLLSRGDQLSSDDLVLGRHRRQAENGPFALPPDGIDLHKLENELVRQALARAGNNQTKAAKLLGLSRDAFRYRLDKLGLLKS